MEIAGSSKAVPQRPNWELKVQTCVYKQDVHGLHLQIRKLGLSFRPGLTDYQAERQGILCELQLNKYAMLKLVGEVSSTKFPYEQGFCSHLWDEEND